MVGPSGEPANVVVFVFAATIMMLSMSQLRATFGMTNVSKQLAFNQMAIYRASHPSDRPDVFANKQQRDFCKAQQAEGTARSGKLKLVSVTDSIGFCSMHTPTWGFLLPQLQVLNVARPPPSTTSASLTLSPENLQASHLATTPVHLEESMQKGTYTSDELAGQYGIQSIKPGWTIPQLKDFVAFMTTAFHFSREGQAVSGSTARHFASNIGSYIGFCATFRNLNVAPTLLVRYPSTC